ncbi:hypothetical protein BDD12DRAFT_901976 [Trichophaea hybrida]|nr:hypothetical protein BDD12DRAFT_901976 [Trichophaea hybrida]
MPQLTKVLTVPILPTLKGSTDHDHCPASSNHRLPGAYWGPHVEDPKKSTLFINYDSPEAYTTFQTSSACCPQLQKAVSYPTDASYDAELNPPSSKILGSAPIIETAKFHLKPEVTRECWLEQQRAVEALLDAGVKGCVGYSSGFCTETEKDFLSLVGWESVEAHETWAAEEKAKQDSVLRRYDELIVGCDMFHVAVKEVMPGASSC